MILGKKETIERARKSGPDDKSNHVNWDAIDNLPEEYEAVITEVTYDPNNLKASFSDVGNETYMPKPELMYAIAEASGITGGENVLTEPLIEEVDWNRIQAKIGEPPRLVRAKVGARVRKFSRVMQEDGTFRYSDVCTSEYNAYERCCELWSKEEMYTDGYKKAGKYDNKYQTSYARQAHFDTEMKFAHSKAETKAHLKTIRVLAGLMTGYKKDDLKSGVLIFSKIRRSSAVLKMETAARLTALSNGSAPGLNAARQLFGPTEPKEQPPVVEQDIEDAVTEPVEKDPWEHEAKFATKREEFIFIMGSYYPKMVPESDQEQANRILSWVKAKPDCETEPKGAFSKALDFLKGIESQLPDELRKQHSLY